MGRPVLLLWLLLFQTILQEADKQSGPLCPHMLHSYRDEKQTPSPLGALRPLPTCSWGGGGASEVIPAKYWGEVKGGSKLKRESPTLSRRGTAWGGAGHSAPE
uniref:Uncharacterized protein n=1 Tax=Rangifer tarandus platyrhynchus TaxID=3082113 RepID=A0ACB0FEA2_RANTA|nr:unnamed protein product [Rangifer tarandus platyrhynchus]